MLTRSRAWCRYARGTQKRRKEKKAHQVVIAVKKQIRRICKNDRKESLRMDEQGVAYIRRRRHSKARTQLLHDQKRGPSLKSIPGKQKRKITSQNKKERKLASAAHSACIFTKSVSRRSEYKDKKKVKKNKQGKS